MVDQFNLKDKVAIVTGGSGQLGSEYCKVLSDAGAKVAVFDIRNNTESVLNKNVQFFQVDITQKLSIENALKRVIDQWGVPCILVNNAALDSPPDSAYELNLPFEDFPEDLYDSIMEVNVKGVFLCSQVIGKAMLENKQGSIINISSIYGIVSPNHDVYEYKNSDGQKWFKPAVYSISKSALINFTRYLATYWAKAGIRVNTVSPAGIYNNQDEEFLKEYCKRIPIGRMAYPHELGGTILYLASDASSYVTGANIVIDGGWSAW
jgi:NAD(P)-dependent dehydrogenase (short-subunit alcohol dehydrogenase family)